MLGKRFRPWGMLPWVLDRISPQRWDILGCLSTEQRCLSALKAIISSRSLEGCYFIQIKDPPSRFSAEVDTLLQVRREEFATLTGRPEYIEEHQLFEPYHILVDRVRQIVSDSRGNILFDISSFPKRYFFPILKILLASNSIENLIATYTVPREYCRDSLAEDPESWAPIPLFGPQGPPSAKVELVFVGVGFLAFNLPELLESEYRDSTITLFFPFPPGPPGYQRNWEFLRKIERYLSLNSPQCEIKRVHAYDVSDVFEHICQATNSGDKNSIFAPYGPKSISLAMSIYASLTKSAIYYTQPKAYNPRYSTGVKIINGAAEIYAYCLRLNGRNLYTLRCGTENS